MTSILKNVYIDKLDDVVNEYNTYFFNLKKKLMIKILNLKLVSM